MVAEQRSLLGRLVVEVFAAGERDIAAAVEKCVARYVPLRPEGARTARADMNGAVVGSES